MRILYVEDDETTREIFAKILKKFAKEVITAKDAFEGYEKYKKFKPDIIITDLNMPDKNGLELIKEIREEDENVVIIIVTAYQEFEYALKAIQEKVDYLFLKPISDIHHYLEILEKYANNILLEKENKKREKIINTILNKIFDISFIVENDAITSLNKRAETFIKENTFSQFQQNITPQLQLKEIEEIIKYKRHFFKITITQIEHNIYLVTLNFLA